jgi:hypothetical protein
MTGNGDPVQLGGANVTANYFDLLGVKPLRGRLFLKEEEMTADVAVVSQNFWRNRLGSDPNVVGRSVNLNGVATTIVGVIPNMPIIWWGPNAEVWTVKPFDFPGLTRDRLMRGVSFLRVIGRMKPGTTIEQVRAAMPSLHQGYKRSIRECRQLVDLGRADVKRERHWPDARAVCDPARRGRCRPAHRVQQCRESAARAFHWTPARDRAPDGSRRVASGCR